MAGCWRVRVVGVVAAAVTVWAVVAAPAAAQSGGFGDVAEDTYYSVPVAALAELGVFAGTECEAGFCPHDAIDRKTMAVWMVRALDGEDPPAVSESRFNDVDAHSFHAPFIERMAELGVTGGCGDGSGFCPDRVVSRAQMAVFLTRAYGLPAGADPGFSDVADDAWYGAAVSSLAASGITGGCGDGTMFCPQRDTSRAHMATFIHRAENPTSPDTCHTSGDASYVAPVAVTDVVSNSRHPSWSPDCAEIAYERNVDVLVMSPSGEHRRTVWDYFSVLWDGAGAGSSPSWSPDGTRIALAAENTGSADPYWGRHIYVVNADGSDRTRLTQGRQWDNSPSWSPGGTEIVFSRSFNRGDSYLVKVAADGTSEIVLTAGGVREGSPSWSPDGQSIGFLTEHGELKVMSPDGSNQRTVVASNATTSMSWSPDSSQIAYARVHDEDDSCVSIMIVNADGTDSRRITNLAGRSTQPAWSPDGELLLFTNSPISGFSQIYVVNPNVDSGVAHDEPCPQVSSYEPDTSLTVGYEQQLGIPQAGVPASWRACRPPRQPGYASTGFPRPIRAPAIGKLRVAVLFVDFPDAGAAYSTRAEISTPNDDLVHYPGDGSFISIPDNLAAIEKYLETASYGKLDVELIPLDRWLRTPHTLLSFLVDYGAFFQRSAVSEQINVESVSLAGTEIDWSAIDVVMTVLPSAYFHGGAAQGAVRINDRIVPTLRLNVIPRGEARSGPLSWGSSGAHELFHVLGLTDLYPTQQPGYQGEFMVPTPPEGMDRVRVEAGLMGLQGYYFAPLDHLDGIGNLRQSPIEMLAWHRWQLGWLESDQIRCVTEPSETIILRSITDPGSGIAMAAIPVSDTKQIVIESRRSTGYDNSRLLRLDAESISVKEERSYGGVFAYVVDSSLSELPIKFATDDGDGILEQSPVLPVGSSVVVDGYEIRVIADAGDTHTVQITKLS